MLTICFLKDSDVYCEARDTGYRNVEEVAVAFKCVQREATKGSREMWMEHSSTNLQHLACDAVGFLILQPCDMTGLLLLFSR